MANTMGTRQCRDCGLEKLWIADGKGADRWHGRRCPECARAERKRLYDASGKHVPGRQRKYRQHAEVNAVLNGTTAWVTCSRCKQMKLFKPNAKGDGVGWRNLVCPDCSNQYVRQWKADKQAEGARSGVCSKCGQEGEYRQGKRCAGCVRAHNAAHLRTRRADGKTGRQYLPAHSTRVCKACKNRCRVAGTWVDGNCPPCVKRTQKSNRKELRQRMVKAGEWECSGCHQVQPVEDGGKGWQGQKCPPCHRAHVNAYQRKRYQTLKDDPDFIKAKRRRYRDHYQRVKGKKANHSPSAVSGAGIGRPELRNAGNAAPGRQGGQG